MKKYTRDYQIEMSIDWVFLGLNNYLAHFSSSGGILPTIIAENADINIELNEFIETIQPFTKVVMNPLLGKFIDINKIQSLEGYSYFASKGLFSFDKTYACPGDNEITYHLIASPLKPLAVNDLPQRIRELLIKTKQSINFSDFYKLDAGFIPWSQLFHEYEIRAHYEIIKEKRKFW